MKVKDEVEYQIEALYKLQNFLVLVNIESIPASSFEEAKRKVFYHSLPYVIYEDYLEQLASVKNGIKTPIRESQINCIMALSAETDTITYEQFISQLKSTAKTIGLKELPFEPMTVSVRNATF